MKRRHSSVKTVTAEVDLDEWDDDELVEEMESRGFICTPATLGGAGLQAITVYEDWKLRGKDAYDKMVDYVLQQAGRIA